MSELSTARKAPTRRSVSAASAAVIAGVLVVAAGCASASATTSPAGVATSTYPAAATQSVAACRMPSGPVVYAFQVSSGQAPPIIKVYLGGLPGVGPMCIENPKYQTVAVPARNRALAYLYVELNKVEGFWRVWGATPGDVHRIVVTVDGGVAQDFVVGDPQKAVALGALANSWRSFNTYTFGTAALPGKTVVTAYNQAGDLLDSAILS